MQSPEGERRSGFRAHIAPAYPIHAVAPPTAIYPGEIVSTMQPVAMQAVPAQDPPRTGHRTIYPTMAPQYNEVELMQIQGQQQLPVPPVGHIRADQTQNSGEQRGPSHPLQPIHGVTSPTVLVRTSQRGPPTAQVAHGVPVDDQNQIVLWTRQPDSNVMHMNEIVRTSNVLIIVSLFLGTVCGFALLPLLTCVLGIIGAGGARAWAIEMRNSQGHSPRRISSSIVYLRVAGGIHIFTAVILLVVMVTVIIGVSGVLHDDDASAFNDGAHGLSLRYPSLDDPQHGLAPLSDKVVSPDVGGIVPVLHGDIQNINSADRTGSVLETRKPNGHRVVEKGSFGKVAGYKRLLGHLGAETDHAAGVPSSGNTDIADRPVDGFHHFLRRHGQNVQGEADSYSGYFSGYWPMFGWILFVFTFMVFIFTVIAMRKCFFLVSMLQFPVYTQATVQP